MGAVESGLKYTDDTSTDCSVKPQYGLGPWAQAYFIVGVQVTPTPISSLDLGTAHFGPFGARFSLFGSITL